MCRCLILIGMMGAGKTTIGRNLADALGRPFIDTDVLLQQRLGRTIPQIFQIYGESAFRDHETSVLRSLDRDGSVLSTGGGAVIRPDNWTEMKRLGTTIYLEAEPDTLIARLESSRKRRPLLEVDQWHEQVKKLLELRRPFYERADLRIRVDDMEVMSGAKRVLELLEANEGC